MNITIKKFRNYDLNVVDLSAYETINLILKLLNQYQDEITFSSWYATNSKDDFLSQMSFDNKKIVERIKKELSKELKNFNSDGERLKIEKLKYYNGSRCIVQEVLNNNNRCYFKYKKQQTKIKIKNLLIDVGVSYDTSKTSFNNFINNCLVLSQKLENLNYRTKITILVPFISTKDTEKSGLILKINIKKETELLNISRIIPFLEFSFFRLGCLSLLNPYGFNNTKIKDFSYRKIKCAGSPLYNFKEKERQTILNCSTNEQIIYLNLYSDFNYIYKNI